MPQKDIIKNKLVEHKLIKWIYLFKFMFGFNTFLFVLVCICLFMLSNLFCIQTIESEKESECITCCVSN